MDDVTTAKLLLLQEKMFRKLALKHISLIDVMTFNAAQLQYLQHVIQLSFSSLSIEYKTCQCAADTLLTACDVNCTVSRCHTPVTQ